MLDEFAEAEITEFAETGTTIIKNEALENIQTVVEMSQKAVDAASSKYFKSKKSTGSALIKADALSLLAKIVTLETSFSEQCKILDVAKHIHALDPKKFNAIQMAEIVHSLKWW